MDDTTAWRAQGPDGTDRFGDALADGRERDVPEAWFDRFMFNLHPDGEATPTVIVGLGVYPPRDVVDGYVIAVIGGEGPGAGEQRNLRFSTEFSAQLSALGAAGDDPLDPAGARRAGPLAWAVEAPHRRWRLALGPNPIGVELDVVWEAAGPPWSGRVGVENAAGSAPTAFDHLFQPGRYAGRLVVDGAEYDVTGWRGTRDRSRGVRTLRGGQGLHLWMQAHFEDRALGLVYVEDRDGARGLLEGAVMHGDGRLDDVVDFRHRLVFDDGHDLRSAVVEVRTAAGERYEIDADAGRRGGYMAGGGYGSGHGIPRGRDHLEHDVYALDGGVGPATLDTALTDRTTIYDWDGRRGSGIFEFARTRSPRYVYRPTLPDSDAEE